MHTSPRRSMMVVVDSRERSIRPALERSEGLPSVVVFDDLEALQNYLQQGGCAATRGYALRPGLILLNVDLSLPSIREMLQALLTEPSSRPIPTLALVQMDDEIGQVYDLGINACILRPESLEGQKRILEVLASFWFRVAALPNHLHEVLESYESL